MNEIIVTSAELLKTIVKEVVNEALGNRTEPQALSPDKCNLNDACQYLTHDLGYSIRKSTIYKLSAKNDIPCQRFGNRLVFSRKDLKNWFDIQIESKSKFNASLELAKSAQKKLRRG